MGWVRPVSNESYHWTCFHMGQSYFPILLDQAPPCIYYITPPAFSPSTPS